MMKTIIVLLMVVVLSNALFENTYSVKAIKNAKTARRIMYDVDQIILIYFWVEDCENCRNAQSLVEKVADENEGIFKVFHVDCEEIWKDDEAKIFFPHCEVPNRKMLPQISFFAPPMRRFTNGETDLQAIEHRFQGEASPKSLAGFGHKLMHPFRVQLKDMDDYNAFLQKEPNLKKVILFTEKKQTAPIYKALTLLYLQRLHFAEVIDSPEANELLDDFEIEEYPQLYLLEPNGDGTYSRDRYTGDLIWKPLKAYLEEAAAQERQTLTNPEDIFPKEQQQTKRERRQRGASTSEQQQQQKEGKEETPVGPVIREFNETSFEQVLLKNEKPALVHVYQEAHHKNWNTTIAKYKSLFDYYEVKVTPENEKYIKDNLGTRGYPNIRYMTVGNAQKKRATKVHFPNDLDFEEISKDILDLVEDRSFSVNPQELQMKLSSGLQEGKILVVLFYNTNSVGLNFRVLSSLSRFSEKFRFLSFRDAPAPVLEQFQIRAQPQISILFREVQNPDELELELKQDQIRLASLPGRLEFDQIVEFLENFDSEKSQSGGKKLELVETNTKLEELCNSKVSTCMIGLLNGAHKKVQHPGDESKTKWEYQLDVMKKIKDKYGQKPVSFIYIDAYCHDELLFPLDLSDDFLPNYIAYTPSKKQYTKMIGIFDFDSINRFVDNHFKGRTQVFNVQKPLSLTEKNCDQVLLEREQRSNESSTGADDDDDILREILEEERLKREAIEKELKKEKKKKKKSKKDSEDL